MGNTVYVAIIFVIFVVIVIVGSGDTQPQPSTDKESRGNQWIDHTNV